MEQWLPKSVLCPEELHASGFFGGPRGRHHRRPGGSAAWYHRQARGRRALYVHHDGGCGAVHHGSDRPVEFGMILAALLFIRKVTATTTVSEVTDDYVEAGRAHILQDKDIPDYVRVFRIHGPFLFGATDKLDLLSE